MKRKVIFLTILLSISLMTVAFITVKYVHTVRSFNEFYYIARETAAVIDEETADLERQITSMEEEINTLQNELQSVAAERDELSRQLSEVQEAEAF